jgi:hypothetical protein
MLDHKLINSRKLLFILTFWKGISRAPGQIAASSRVVATAFVVAVLLAICKFRLAGLNGAR